MTEIQQATCQRCGLALRVDPKRGSNAKMLKRAAVPNGLCVHCAVHDWLRNTYPINIQLAENGPGALLVPALQRVYSQVMRVHNADAQPEEISWSRIVEFWELPFPNKVKASPANPMTQRELDEVASGKRLGAGTKVIVSRKPPPRHDEMAVRTFEELNELEDGLGDALRDLFCRDAGRAKKRRGGRRKPPDDKDPPRQLTFW